MLYTHISERILSYNFLHLHLTFKWMNQKKKFPALFCLFMLFVTSYYSCTKDVGPLPTSNVSLCDSLNVKYAADIKPIMITYCAISGCHETGYPYGDLSAYTADLQAYVNSGALRNQVIVTKAMPQTGGPLSFSDLQKIDCWLSAGAPNN